MVITESELRELWRNGSGQLPAFPPHTRFTPSAQDFIKDHRLDIQTELPTDERAHTAPSWDKPAAFPVVLTGPLPVCTVCGQPLARKPDHMTQLDSQHFASKTDPRIKLRGQIDTLHALTLLVAAEARRFQLPAMATLLDTLAAYCREIQSAEYNNRALQPLALNGKTEEEIHRISHNPDEQLGLPHLTPGGHHHSILHWLNLLRATTRETELSALEVYPHPHRADLIHGFNRFSSAVYYLELLLAAGQLGWNPVTRS